jgi:hypothetical protein
MGCAKGLRQHHLPVNRNSGRKPHLKRKGMMEKGKFHHQVIDGAVEAELIVLIGLTVVERRVRIGVMRHKGMDRGLWSDRERKQRQERACQDRPYRPMESHKSLKLRCKLREESNNLQPIDNYFLPLVWRALIIRRPGCSLIILRPPFRPPPYPPRFPERPVQQPLDLPVYTAELIGRPFLDGLHRRGIYP